MQSGFMPAIPATLNQELRPIIVNNRSYLVRTIINYIIPDLIQELQIKSGIILYYICDEGTQFGYDNSREAMATYPCKTKNEYLIQINLNCIEYVCDMCNMFYFVNLVVKTFAHEMRHVWQRENNKFDFTNHTFDENYANNYNNIDFEQDAFMFGDIYSEQRYFIVRSLALMCIGYKISKQTLLINTGFDPYDFLNHMAINYRNLLNTIFGTFLSDIAYYKHITFEPYYDNGKTWIDYNSDYIKFGTGIKINTPFSIQSIVEDLLYVFDNLSYQLYNLFHDNNYNINSPNLNASYDYIRPILTSLLQDYLLEVVY